MNPKLKIIYDLGANVGSNIAYYLKKADLVVAVEANPELCQEMMQQFQLEISSGKLVVENCVITTSSIQKEVPFYIHKRGSVKSQFPTPENLENFDKVTLPSRSVLGLFSQYGEPYYVKIDLENYDEVILREIFENNIRPPYVSAESHSVNVFAILVLLGQYNAFKLVDGWSVDVKNKHRLIEVDGQRCAIEFPRHSAGPFGEDIHGEWMDAASFFRMLAYEGLGWKDIHATNITKANPAVKPNFDIYIRRYYRQKFKRILQRIGLFRDKKRN